MISVPRNTHMPSVEASFCCSMSAKWCWRSECSCSCVASAEVSANGDLLRGGDFVVVIGFPCYFGSLFKIGSDRWRLRRPFQPSRAPGIVAGDLAIPKRPDHINHGKEISDGKDAGAGGR